MKKLTQRDKILNTLRDVAAGRMLPAGYVVMRSGVAWLSARYLKQVLLISECNGRISEARADGFDVQTLEGEKDEYSFAFHRLAGEPKKQVVRYETVIKTACEWRGR